MIHLTSKNEIQELDETLTDYLSKVHSSVTKCGEILKLWLIFKVFGNFFEFFVLGKV